MSFKYKEKIRLKRISHTIRVDPKLEMDLRDIDRNFNIVDKNIKKPRDLEVIMSEIRTKFNALISPFVSGEYKEGSHPTFVYDSANKAIKLKYQLMSLSEHLNDFVFQLRMYVISQSDDRDKIKEIEKEIKEWERISNKVINDLVDKISFVIQNYFVPICDSIEKKKVRI